MITPDDETKFEWWAHRADALDVWKRDGYVTVIKSDEGTFYVVIANGATFPCPITCDDVKFATLALAVHAGGRQHG